jgi:hypothetical protein
MRFDNQSASIPEVLGGLGYFDSFSTDTIFRWISSFPNKSVGIGYRLALEIWQRKAPGSYLNIYRIEYVANTYNAKSH